MRSAEHGLHNAESSRLEPALLLHLISTMSKRGNSFVIVGRLSALPGSFLSAMPRLHEDFFTVEPALGTPAEQHHIDQLYERISPADFS